MKCEIESLDHFVLTVVNIEKAIAFYTQVLDMEVISFGANRKALLFGNQKINLHEVGNELEPHAMKPVAGSSDLCFLSKTPLADWQVHLEKMNCSIIEGPVERTGACFPILSIYVRDVDSNLIEISNKL